MNITAIRKGRTIGVSRDGQPVGTVAKVPRSNMWAARPYCAAAPFDFFGGTFPSEDLAITCVATVGETPDYMKEAQR